MTAIGADHSIGHAVIGMKRTFANIKTIRLTRALYAFDFLDLSAARAVLDCSRHGSVESSGVSRGPLIEWSGRTVVIRTFACNPWRMLFR